MRISARLSALAMVVCALLALLACGGDEEPAKGSFNSVCDGHSPCGSGLFCVGASGAGRGICSTMCASDADCVAHPSGKCVGAGVGVGYCYKQCTDSVECPGTHTCTMTATEAFSTCRASN